MPALYTPPPRGGRTVAPAFAREPGELSAFLPAPTDPDYLWVLSELVCDDMAQHWAGGHARLLSDYRSPFPELFENPSVLQPVADQEYQLRKAAGQDPDSGEYLNEYGVEPPSSLYVSVDTPFPAKRLAASTHRQTLRQTIVPMRGANAATRTALGAAAESEDEFARVPAEQFPAVGEPFEGFVLKEHLGRGAFAQVYLAEQVGLSNREVALKLTKRLGKEAGRLARLQHANIVPIFSYHADKDWQAICMPYFGRQTLDDIIRHVRKSRAIPKSGCEVFSTVAAQGDSTFRSAEPKPLPPNGEPVRPTEAGSRGELRQILTNLSYADAAVLLVAQIADGLAHAHSLGIWHLDLKPANVLVSDHGQPMLLDFNLAFDTRHERRERFGGTVPYMAPEQLDEMIESRERTRLGLDVEEPRVSKVDARTDLYAAGIILFELLTGRHPFAASEKVADPFVAARAARRAPRKTARAWNPDVSPGLDAVVERLLAAGKDDRYPSAVALRQDLLNHLEHKPLEHVRVRNVAERFAKWRTRNPKALVRLAAAAACVAAAGATGWGAVQWRATAAAAARDRAADVRVELSTLRMDLAATTDSASVRRGLGRARATFDVYGIADAATLAASPQLNRLDPAARTALLADLGEVAALAGLAESGEQADAWTALAKLCFRGQSLPAALGGDDAGTRSAFLDGVVALRDGRTNDAASRFDIVVKAEPEHAAGQFLYAIALTQQYQYPRAAERFEMAAALAPDDSRAPYNRGLILQSERKLADAEDAYSTALRRDTDMTDAYVQRGQVRLNLGRPRDALADCDAAIRTGGPGLRVYVLRAAAHNALGDREAEAKDLAAVAATPPVTAEDYLARGITRCSFEPKDVTGALADFRTASTLRPTFFQAWNNQAHALALLHEADLALAAMDRAVTANAQSGELRLGRAVLLARVGKREAAHADVEKGLLLTDRAKQTYQAACVYSLTSQTHPADVEKAIDYLRKSIRDGFRNPKHMAEDADLDPIRERDDVVRLFDAVKAMVK